LWKYEVITKLNINKTITILTLKKLEPNRIINNDGNVKSIDLNGTVICLSQLEHLWLTIGLSINFLIKLTDSSLQCGHLNLFTLPPCTYNAHLRGKIELAKIGERSEQNSQLYFVPLEILVIC
jgi:hypothetical protein